VGSLISAVLVGLLALSANHYTRMDPQVLNVLIERIERKLRAPVPPPPPKDSPAAVHAVLEAVEKDLLTLVGRWTAQSPPAEHRQLQADLTAVNNLVTQLEADRKRFDTLSLADKTAFLRVLFMAAELKPEPFESMFRTWCERGLVSTDSAIVTQAAALQFFRSHDLTDPDTDQILQGLDAFSHEYPDPNLGVNLYLNIAKELKNKGHLEISRLVIKKGREVYAGNAAVSRLINWLIDQRLVTQDSSVELR
jgi:hypothetical protein